MGILSGLFTISQSLSGNIIYTLGTEIGTEGKTSPALADHPQAQASFLSQLHCFHTCLPHIQAQFLGIAYVRLCLLSAHFFSLIHSIFRYI